jgi:hypothetical protein
MWIQVLEPNFGLSSLALEPFLNSSWLLLADLADRLLKLVGYLL